MRLGYFVNMVRFFGHIDRCVAVVEAVIECYGLACTVEVLNPLVVHLVGMNQGTHWSVRQLVLHVRTFQERNFYLSIYPVWYISYCRK